MRWQTHYSGWPIIILAIVCFGTALSAGTAPGTAWPRRVTVSTLQVTLYEPEIEAFENSWFSARSAVSVKNGANDPIFGAAWYRLKVNVDQVKRRAKVTGFDLTVARFPDSLTMDADSLSAALAADLINAELLLDPLLQSLERQKAAMAAATAGMAAAPDILVTTSPCVLVLIDGEPQLEMVKGTNVLKVVNTDSLILLQQGTGRWFMRQGTHWLSAAQVKGPWMYTDLVPDTITCAAASQPVSKEENDPRRPRVVVATRPTEIIETTGEPRYTIIPNTTLLYIINTTKDVFLEIGGQRHYVLLAGRWFTTTSLQQGPWTAIAPEKLPATFQNIPPGSPKYGVLAHIPGTKAAKEASIDASMPRTRAVARTPAQVTITYNGTPNFVAIPNTTVYYAVNTPQSVLRISNRYYLCQNAVWYWSVAPTGPWEICLSVPAAVYTIPPTCPVYPVTYVRVYDYTPSVVYVGYSYGYCGWYPAWPCGGVVFGFAYYDDDWYDDHCDHHDHHCHYDDDCHHDDDHHHGHHGYDDHYYHDPPDGHKPGHGGPGHGEPGHSYGAPDYGNRREYHRYQGGKPPSGYGAPQRLTAGSSDTLAGKMQKGKSSGAPGRVAGTAKSVGKPGVSSRGTIASSPKSAGGHRSAAGGTIASTSKHNGGFGTASHGKIITVPRNGGGTIANAPKSRGSFDTTSRGKMITAPKSSGGRGTTSGSTIMSRPTRTNRRSVGSRKAGLGWSGARKSSGHVIELRPSSSGIASTGGSRSFGQFSRKGSQNISRVSSYPSPFSTSRSSGFGKTAGTTSRRANGSSATIGGKRSASIYTGGSSGGGYRSSPSVGKGRVSRVGPSSAATPRVSSPVRTTSRKSGVSHGGFSLPWSSSKGISSGVGGSRSRSYSGYGGSRSAPRSSRAIKSHIGGGGSRSYHGSSRHYGGGKRHR